MIKLSNLTGKPLLLLRENSEEFKDKRALKLNIEAIKTLAESIQSTLGPKGLSKMVIDSLGDTVVSSDGAKILEELLIENPAAKMIVDLSKTIFKKVGDGTSSGVIFIGELMSKTEEMINNDISPTQIYDGFIHASREMKTIINKTAKKIDIDDRKTLKNCAITSLNSKGLYDTKELFGDIVVDTILSIKEGEKQKITIDLDNVQIIKKQGEGLNSSRLIEGIIVDKEVVNPSMPKIIRNAKIALIDGALEIVKTEFSAEIKISTPNEIEAYLKKEEKMLEELVEAIKNSGANVVFCQKGIDETAQHFLSKSGIMAIRRVKNSDMKKLARATKANIITKIKSISPADTGFAEIVSEQKIGKDYMIFLEKCKHPKSVTVLIRGGTEKIVDDAERSLKNGLSAVKNLLECGKIVGGGGSIEIELRKRLIEFAHKVGGKEQIAIEAFGDALEIIPKILIENSGFDPLDVLTNLRSKVDYISEKIMGFDSFQGKIVNVMDEGIIDPVKTKLEIYTLATELAVIFIRVDDYIKSGKK